MYVCVYMQVFVHARPRVQGMYRQLRVQERERERHTHTHTHLHKEKER